LPQVSLFTILSCLIYSIFFGLNKKEVYVKIKKKLEEKEDKEEARSEEEDGREMSF